MEFTCRNKNCERFNQEESCYKVVTVYGSDGPVCKQQPCPKCGEMRENTTEIIPLSQKHIGVLKIPSMTKEQKTAMLKKRSHEHYVKEIKESANFKLGSAMKEMRGGK